MSYSLILFLGVFVALCCCTCCPSGAGTFGTVKAGTYRPKNGGPEVECAVKALKPMDELPNQKVRSE